MRIELSLVVSFSFAWLLAICMNLGLLPVAGTLDLGLYPLYSLAAALGWVAGNTYVTRRVVYPQRFRRRLLLNYLFLPPSVLHILRALASSTVQQAAPLVPLYSFCIYGLFFLVPVTLRTTRDPRRG